MRNFAGLLLGFILTACASAPPPPPAAPVAIADPHADAVAGLVGAWQGPVLGTPLGDFPVAIAFAREANGDGRALEWRAVRVDDWDGLWRRDPLGGRDRWIEPTIVYLVTPFALALLFGEIRSAGQFAQAYLGAFIVGGCIAGSFQLIYHFLW